MSGYIGVDLDGTLAVHTPKSGVDTIGEPIPAMVERVKAWLAYGQEVRIITARVAERYADRVEQAQMIQRWCLEHVGRALVVQSHKCGSMYQLWDDRAIQVLRNTGETLEQAIPDEIAKMLDADADYYKQNPDLASYARSLARRIRAGAWKQS